MRFADVHSEQGRASTIHSVAECPHANCLCVFDSVPRLSRPILKLLRKWVFHFMLTKQYCKCNVNALNVILRMCHNTLNVSHYFECNTVNVSR